MKFSQENNRAGVEFICDISKRVSTVLENCGQKLIAIIGGKGLE
jgi:hypothetical protein